MNQWFLPYRGKKPACVDVNGHKLIILSDSRKVLEQDLALFGADRLRSFKVRGTKIEQDKFLGEIAEKVAGGVVIAPADAEIKDVLRDLQNGLPWLH